MPVLKIDIHEQADHIKSLRDLMKGYKDWTVEVGEMAVSDFAVGNVLGIERKTPSDFLASFGQKRLQQQCFELAQNFSTAVLLIQGNISDVLFNRFRKFNPVSVTAMLASLTVKTHVVPLFCGEKGVPHMVQGLALEAGDDKVVDYVPIRPQANSGDWQLHILSSLPSIGPERAKKLLAEYGTPLRALNAYDEWDKLDGFGRKTVEKIGEIIAARGKIPPQDAQ